jgi:hypothetical protein
VAIAIVSLLELRRRYVADGAVKASAVVLLDPLGGGQLELFK